MNFVNLKNYGERESDAELRCPKTTLGDEIVDVYATTYSFGRALIDVHVYSSMATVLVMSFACNHVQRLS